MHGLLAQANDLKHEIIENRRYFHKNPELGFDLPLTRAHVLKELKSYGYAPETVGKAGIVCTAGKGEKTILLRGDMDALPMEEISGLPFGSKNGSAHACGHDMHTAMMLGAAKLIKQNEALLKGRVKFMFQPAEELLAGARDMIEGGVLEDVSVAMALHIVVGKEETESGVIFYKGGPITYATDALKIRITGLPAHGSMPHLGVDANMTAAHIMVAIDNILAKELAASDDAVVVIGKMSGGTAINTLSGYAELELSPRTVSTATREFIKRRVIEIAENVARAMRAEATVERMFGITFLNNNVQLSSELANFCEELLGKDYVRPMDKFNGSEDFSLVSEMVPSVLLALGVGSVAQGYNAAIHNPAMRADEQALPTGAAVYAHCAMRWLEQNA